jgi:hypothetical protein
MLFQPQLYVMPTVRSMWTEKQRLNKNLSKVIILVYLVAKKVINATIVKTQQ